MKNEIKTSTEMTMDEIKMFPLSDDQLEDVSGGMSVDYAYTGNNISYCFNVGDKVYDPAKNANAYIISRRPVQAPDGYFRAVYKIGGVYNNNNISWDVVEALIEAGWR